MERGGVDNQWVVWDNNSEMYVPRGQDPNDGGVPAWIPRCVTNILKVKIAGIVAILDGADPAQLWAPSTDDDDDRATAEVAQDAVPVLLDEIGWKTLRNLLHRLICLTDKAALLVYYDNDEKYGTASIPFLACQDPDCAAVFDPKAFDDAGQACPECGSDVVGPAVDAVGIPKEQSFPVGKVCARLFSSFEFSTPPYAATLDAEQLPYILLHGRSPKEECLQEWGDDPKKKAAIENASASASRDATGMARQYADVMRTMSGPRSATGQRNGYDGDTLGPVVYRLQHDPIVNDEYDFPDGLYAVVINEVLMEAGPLPVKDDDGRARKSILLRAFYPTPQSPYGHPPADDLVPLQVTRNTVETLLLCILLHLASPREYIPDSVTLEDEPNGSPGQRIRYSTTSPGDKPFIAAGANPPEGLFKYLEYLDQKIEEISQLNAVLSGQRPEGDPTLGEVQRLDENGMRSFTEPLQHLIEFEKHLSRLLLWVAKTSAWAPRFRQVRGENGAWDVKQFTAADISGRIDVQVDQQSAWPKSPLMELLRTQRAIEMGILPPPAADPELQTKLLEQMGLVDLKPSISRAQKQIARELDVWKDAVDPGQIRPSPDPEIDNVPLHVMMKTLWLITEEAEAKQQQYPDVYNAMRAHVKAGRVLMQPPPVPGPPPPPDTRTPVEKGDGSAVDAAVQAGALKPKGAPSGDAIQAALSSGALAPKPPEVPGPARPQ